MKIYQLVKRTTEGFGFASCKIDSSTLFFLNKEAMGEGDIIVAGTMGALLGFPGFLYALFIAAIVALVPSLLAKDTQVPFVPFLIIGTFIAYLFVIQVQSIVNFIIYG